MEGTDKALLWGRPGCPFCAAAERVLKGQGIAYTYIDVGSNEDLRARLADLTGDQVDKLTVPKVFIDGQLITTCDELTDLSLTSALKHLGRRAVRDVPRQIPE